MPVDFNMEQHLFHLNFSESASNPESAISTLICGIYNDLQTAATPRIISTSDVSPTGSVFYSNKYSRLFGQEYVLVANQLKCFLVQEHVYFMFLLSDFELVIILSTHMRDVLVDEKI